MASSPWKIWKWKCKVELTKSIVNCSYTVSVAGSERLLGRLTVPFASVCDRFAVSDLHLQLSCGSRSNYADDGQSNLTWAHFSLKVWSKMISVRLVLHRSKNFHVDLFEKVRCSMFVVRWANFDLFKWWIIRMYLERCLLASDWSNSVDTLSSSNTSNSVCSLNSVQPLEQCICITVGYYQHTVFSCQMRFPISNPLVPVII